MPPSAPPRDASPAAVVTSAASVTPHRVALALLLRLLAGPPHSAEPGLSDDPRARASPPSPPPRRVRQRLALFLLRETRAVHSWHEPPLSMLLLRLAAEVGGGTAGGEAEAGKTGGREGEKRGRDAGARVEGAAAEVEEGEEGWSDVGGVLVRQLQALQSPDDLFSLFASLHCESQEGAMTVHLGHRSVHLNVHFTCMAGCMHGAHTNSAAKSHALPHTCPASPIPALHLPYLPCISHTCPVPTPYLSRTSPPHDHAAACVARSTSPPRHRAAAAASPACQPVTRGSALGLFLRSLLLSFHHLPFQAVCDVLGDIHEYLHHAGCMGSTASTGSMDEQATGRRESTGEASHGEWGSGEVGSDGGEEMDVDVGVGIEGGEPLAFDTVTHRRRTTYEGTRESSREEAGGIAWDGGRGGGGARAGAGARVGEDRTAWEEEFEREVLGRGGRGGGQGDDALMQADGDDGGLWGGGAGRRSSGGMVRVEGEAGEEGWGSGEGRGRGRRKQRGGGGMQKQFLREAGRLAEYLDGRIEEASR
ncbi:unnamed protein product [Closterium sp. NIES-53]